MIFIELGGTEGGTSEQQLLLTNGSTVLPVNRNFPAGKPPPLGPIICLLP